MHPKKQKHSVEKIHAPSDHSSIIYNNQGMEATQVCRTDGMEKKYVVHTHTHTHTMKYYSVIKKKNKILPFATTWMDMEGIVLTEISQANEDKYCMLNMCILLYVNYTSIRWI